MPAIVTGMLQSILGGHVEAGTVEVALCGYGSQVPRMNNATLGARLTDATIPVADDGTFSFGVTANELIQPAGTYYTITIRDANGDIAQVNAYRFADGQTYDLNSTEPYDPSQQPPVNLPFLILNQLLIVPYDPAAVFRGDAYTAWQITLTGDCSPSFTNLVDGNLYTVIVIQDAAGMHPFNWPANVKNAVYVNPTPYAITIQTFVADGNTLYPIGAGTYWP
jgi:hypothetical protein